MTLNIFGDISGLLSSIAPDSWTGTIIVGLLVSAVGALVAWVFMPMRPFIPGTEEYKSRLKAQEIEDAAAKQNNEVFFSAAFNNTEVKIFSGDITRSTDEIIVSSDDTLLSASGGVARSIIAAAGNRIRKRLREISDKGVPRGSIAITSGGLTKFTYILHAVVLTKAQDYTEYANKDEISRLVNRIVEVADAVGVESLAIPILAGGTAAKRLREQGLTNDQEIIKFLFSSLVEPLTRRRTSLKTVFLIVYDNKHLTKELGENISVLIRSNKGRESLNA